MSLNYWNFEPSVVIGSILLISFYALMTGSIRRRFNLGNTVPLLRQIAFYLGTTCMFIALVGPLDVLGDKDLFSAHMAQHMILSFVVPPLWVAGTPNWLIKLLLPRALQPLVFNPLVAFTFFNGVMWMWHIPGIYDAALTNEWIHIAEHLLFMISGVIGFLPVLTSGFDERMSPLAKLIYLFPSLLSCTALAALITLSSVQLYSFYGNAATQWSLTALEDQQIGGAVMWLLGDMLYMGLILWFFNLLLDQENTEGQQVKI